MKILTNLLTNISCSIPIAPYVVRGSEPKHDTFSFTSRAKTEQISWYNRHRHHYLTMGAKCHRLLVPSVGVNQEFGLFWPCRQMLSSFGREAIVY